MTELDEALIWARKRAFEYTNPVYWDAIRSGHADHDWGIPEMAKGYRAGQAASAERIRALEEAIRRLTNMLAENDHPPGLIMVVTKDLLDARALLKEADQ